MKRLRDMAELRVDSVQYLDGQVVAEFTLRGAIALRKQDAGTATKAMLQQFRKLLELNNIKHFAWPPNTVEVDAHSDFRGFKGKVATLAQEPAIAVRAS